MILISSEQLEFFQLEEAIWIAEAKTKVPIYDFKFENYFACRHPLYLPENIQVIGRFGVSDNYSALYQELKESGINLIHSPENYLLASELTNWYPLLEDLTPRSLWFDSPPTCEEVEKLFKYPIFIKGSRQTSRHKAELSIVRNRKEYENVALHFQQNPILHWQKFVIREFVELRKVDGKITEKIPPAFEFRTFWWKSKLVGAGSYWKDFANYTWTEKEKFDALQISEKAVKRLHLPFVVIDVAQKQNGEWIVIECNDAQESGYADVSPIGLWQNIIEVEKS